MTGERNAIAHPLVVDFGGQPIGPLRFLLQDAYAPTGIVEYPSEGMACRHTPWLTEVVLDLTGTTATAVLYLLPKDERTVLLAACLDQVFEPFFKLMAGGDYGDAVTRLVATHWPEVHAMLARSNSSSASGRVLAVVTTSGRNQWVVADHVPSSPDHEIPSRQMHDLIGAALTVYSRIANAGVELPGLINVLGGPDRTSRRLTSLAGLLGAVGDFGTAFGGGIKADELYGMAMAAREAVTNAVDLADRGTTGRRDGS